MKRLNWLDWTAFVLVIIGGLNWGLIGFFGYNLVTAIFGTALFSRIIFAVVGIAALYSVYTLTKLSSTSMTTTTTEQERMRRVA